MKPTVVITIHWRTDRPYDTFIRLVDVLLETAFRVNVHVKVDKSVKVVEQNTKIEDVTRKPD